MKLLDRREVADILNISAASLTQIKYLEYLGLPVVKVGRLVRFRPEDVQRVIDKGLRRTGTSGVGKQNPDV